MTGVAHSVRREVPRAARGVWRAVAVTLVLLVLSLTGLDFVLRFWAERWLAGRVEQNLALTSSPEVDLAGFPFLLQVARGRFSNVQVHLDEVATGGLVLDGIEMDLEDVGFSRSALLSGGEAEVKVGEGTGEAEVGEASLNEFLHEQGVAVNVDLVGPGIEASTTIEVGGQESTATAIGPLRLRGGALVFEPQRVRVDGSFGVPTESLSFRIDLPAPFTGVRYTGSEVTDGLLILEATLRGSAIPIG